MTFSSKFRATGTSEVALRQVLGLRDTERKFDYTNRNVIRNPLHITNDTLHEILHWIVLTRLTVIFIIRCKCKNEYRPVYQSIVR